MQSSSNAALAREPSSERTIAPAQMHRIRSLNQLYSLINLKGSDVGEHMKRGQRDVLVAISSDVCNGSDDGQGCLPQTSKTFSSRTTARS
jgi:hypothetical protein